MNVPRLRRDLLRWFARVRRPLPWRRTRDPYAVWVSEMMLQQTTVSAVIPFFERFVARFPNVGALAEAGEESVLSLWSGLGYYSRARNLRLGAKQIMAEYGGRFPSTVEGALTLRGVGPYTARAVTSIAYGTRAAVVDGNVRRVLARLFAIRGLDVRAFQERADALLPRKRPGDWNEAMMELGATVCTPRNPDCVACPVAADCEGKARPHHWSEQKRRPQSERRAVALALVEKGDTVLLEQRGEGPLMSGLLDLPAVGLPGDPRPSETLGARYRGVLKVSGTELLRVRHTITRYRIDAAVSEAFLGSSRLPGHFRMVSRKNLADVPLSGLTRKVLRGLGVLEEGN